MWGSKNVFWSFFFSDFVIRSLKIHQNRETDCDTLVEKLRSAQSFSLKMNELIVISNSEKKSWVPKINFGLFPIFQSVAENMELMKFPNHGFELVRAGYSGNMDSGLWWRGFVRFKRKYSTGSETCSNLSAQLFLLFENHRFEVTRISDKFWAPDRIFLVWSIFKHIGVRVLSRHPLLL